MYFIRLREINYENATTNHQDKRVEDFGMISRILIENALRNWKE